MGSTYFKKMNHLSGDRGKNKYKMFETTVSFVPGNVLNRHLHPRKLAWIPDTQNDGLEKVVPFKYAPFLVFIYIY